MIDLDATPCCPTYGCGGALHRQERRPVVSLPPVVYVCEDCGHDIDWHWPDEPLTWRTVSRYSGPDVHTVWYDRLLAEVEWAQQFKPRTDEELEGEIEELEAQNDRIREEVRRLKCELSVRWP